jgi:hypothetical protein
VGGLLLLVAVGGGVAATFALEDKLAPSLRLAAGTVVGLVWLGLDGFVSASWLGLTSFSVSAAALVSAAPLLLLARPGPRGRLLEEVRLLRASLSRRPKGSSLAVLLLFLLCAGLSYRLSDRAVFLRQGAWHTGVDHNIGDLPFHLALVQGFAVADNFPPEHPELAGTRLTYPFLVDFLAALFTAVGVPLPRALLVQNLVLGLCLLVLLYHLGLQLTGSRLAALLTPVLTLQNGGLGFLGFFREAQGRGIVELLSRLPHDYTIEPSGPLRWGNAIITLLIPQRALLLGIPLFVLATLLLWQGVREDGTKGDRDRRLLAAGVVTGLLPLAHAHCFAVLLAVAAALAVLFPRRSWVGFFLVASLLSAPQLLWLMSGSSLHAARFVGVQVGWDRGQMGVLPFWLLNTGVFIPLLLLALLLPTRAGRLPRRLRLFYLPFACCFLVPNLLRLSPWIWDNVKFLFLWYVVSAPLVAALLATLFRRRVLGWLAAGVLLLTLTLSGALDTWRAASGAMDHVVFDRDGVVFADWVRRNTPPRARFVVAPTYNHPVLFSGRPELLGYEGHLWSQGLDGSAQREAVDEIYTGARDPLPLLRLYHVDYVVLSPFERRFFERPRRAFPSLHRLGAVGSFQVFEVPR